MKLMKRIAMHTGFLLILSVAGCGSKESAPDDTFSSSPTPLATVLPKVTDERTDLVLSWYEEGSPKVGSQVSDVPEEAQKEVRIQDPTIPPEQRNPDVVFIADLTKKTDKGYEVRAVKRSEFEAKRQAERDKAAKTEAEALAGAAGAGAPPQGTTPKFTLPNGEKPRVIMYATKHCPVCVKARRWLLEQKIPYIEKDLETDQAAALEVQKKGQAQGVSTNGVPIFEINGRILPGFDPAQIVALLVKNIGTQKTI
jgi:glutaredoxin